jgi:hypothetical protein
MKLFIYIVVIFAELFLGSSLTNCEADPIPHSRIQMEHGDTLVSKGNEIIFFKPTPKEYEALLKKNGIKSGINEVESDFNFYAKNISDSLKGSNIKVVFCEKTIIKIIAFDNSVSYLNRLNNGSSNYGIIINFEKTEPVVEFGVSTDVGILSLIKHLRK